MERMIRKEVKIDSRRRDGGQTQRDERRWLKIKKKVSGRGEEKEG